MRTDWDNVFKIRTTNPDKSRDKHEVVKLLLVRALMKKHSRNLFIRIYTEFRLDNGAIPDVYFENLKTKEAYAYEIQKNMSNRWLNEIKEKYENYQAPFFDTFDYIIIDLSEFSDNINEIREKVEEYIV